MLSVVPAIFNGDPTPIVGGGTVIALVSISVTLLYRMAKVVPQAYIDQIDSLESSQAALRVENTELRKQHNADVTAIRVHYNEEIGELRKANAKCERISNLLIRSLQQAGVSIPDEVWQQ